MPARGFKQIILLNETREGWFCGLQSQSMGGFACSLMKKPKVKNGLPIEHGSFGGAALPSNIAFSNVRSVLVLLLPVNC